MPLIELADDTPNQARIKVIGVGGGGGNAINTMIAGGLEGVDFIAANTDLQALESNLAPTKVQLGAALTRGLGAGANPDVGRNSALEDTARIQEALQGADMVFVTAGMGGGTGTGAAPVIAQVAKDLGALTVGVVTKPFRFEGKRRMRQADVGMDALEQAVDTLIAIPNERLLTVAGQATSMLDAFRKVDDVLLNAVQGISDLVVIHGFINVDFADVRTVMSEKGHALMGSGYALGDRKALEAAKQAINSPLLEDVSIDGATGILINITGGPDLTLAEINEAAMLIQEAAHEDANIIFGSVVDANMEDQVRITVIATGFDGRLRVQESPRSTHAARPRTQTGSTSTSHHSAMQETRRGPAEPAYALASNPGGGGRAAAFGAAEPPARQYPATNMMPPPTPQAAAPLPQTSPYGVFPTAPAPLPLAASASQETYAPAPLQARPVQAPYYAPTPVAPPAMTAQAPNPYAPSAPLAAPEAAVYYTDEPEALLVEEPQYAPAQSIAAAFEAEAGYAGQSDGAGYDGAGYGSSPYTAAGTPGTAFVHPTPFAPAAPVAPNLGEATASPAPAAPSATEIARQHQQRLAQLPAPAPQTSFPYSEAPTAVSDPGDPTLSARPRRMSGQHASVPRLHPSLQVPEESEIDTPAFLRRGRHPLVSD